MPDRPVDVLFVATWYPSVEDAVAGRFVADQAEALLASGRARPAVVSFEPAGLVGSGGVRDRIAATVARLAGAAIHGEPALFAPRAHGGPAGVPVARLTIAHGRHPAGGPAHAARARDAALGALAERLLDESAPTDPPVPSIVHAHTAYPDGAGAAALAGRLGRPLVITEHASFVGRLLAEPAIRARYVAAIERAARVVVVSRTLARELVAALPEIEPKIVVVPNAVSLEAFEAASRGASRRPGELLYVGYRKASKGIETLLQAFAMVRRMRATTTLRLIGASPSDPIEDGWRRRAARLGVGDAVRFEPAADRAGVAAAMARADLFVHPSPRETFGIVAVEALAAGLPVVAVDSGGVTEILGDEPEALGAIVPPNDPAALADAIVRALDRRDRFEPAVLRASVEGRFGMPVVAGRIADVYDAVLAEAGAPARGRPTPATRQSTRPAIGQVTRAAPATRPAGPTRRAAPSVVVAFDPDRAALLARLPGAVRARIVLVTSVEARPPDGLAAVVTADLRGRARAVADAALLGPPSDGLPRRILRVVRHPLAVARRRGLVPGLEGLVTSRGSAAVREGLRAAREAGPPDARPRLACVDGLDHLAAAVLVDAGEAILAAGGLRRLADPATAATADE